MRRAGDHHRKLEDISHKVGDGDLAQPASHPGESQQPQHLHQLEQGQHALSKGAIPESHAETLQCHEKNIDLAQCQPRRGRGRVEALHGMQSGWCAHRYGSYRITPKPPTQVVDRKLSIVHDEYAALLVQCLDEEVQQRVRLLTPVPS